MTTSQTSNPLATFGMWLTVAVLAFVGISMLTGRDELFARFALPIGFFCSLFAIVFMVFQVRTGKISIVSKSGLKSTFTRKDDPVWFFLISAAFFLIAGFLAVALGSDLIFGCEGSLINSCPVDPNLPVS